jgi:hypothetical protein
MKLRNSFVTAGFAALALAGASVLGSAESAQAGSLVNCNAGCNVGSLITNGDYFDIDGDKRYSDFTVDISQVIGGIPNPVLTASNIVVRRAGNGDSGISFSFPALATANNVLNLSLGYQLTALGNNLISSMATSMVSGVNGGGLVLIKENVSAIQPGPNPVVAKLLTYDTGDASTSKLSDFQLLDVASKQVAVQKDIQLFGGAGPAGFSSLSIVNQNPEVTPVPTPALLPGLAAFGMSLVRKRKQEQAA